MRIDCHNDTALFLRDRVTLRTLPQAHLDFDRLQTSLDAAIFGIFIHEEQYAGQVEEEFARILQLLKADIAAQPDMGLLLWKDQLTEVPAEKLVLLSMEGAAPLGKDAQHFDEYVAQGLRAIGLTWNYDTYFAGCNLSHSGLTQAGKELVARCNEAGVLIDVAHASRETLADILACSSKPILDSHTVCAALNDCPRAITDDELQELAAKGGVAAITFVKDFLGGKGDLDRLCDHIEHAVALVGSEHVGLGADYDGAGLHEECCGVEKLPMLYARLKERGMQDADIRNVAGESVRRLLQQVLP